MAKITDVEIAKNVGLSLEELTRLVDINGAKTVEHLLKTTLEDIITLKFSNNIIEEKYITITVMGGAL